MTLASSGSHSDKQMKVISLVVGTAGHIDHGKTSLVQALTGTNTDRLPEEKRRGITIDLGFAALQLGGPLGESIELSFVDVPGHHAFLQNMIAGVGGVNYVLLVIAADEGVREQTRQHLTICTLLGVRSVLVALTKIDVVIPARLEESLEEARVFLRENLFNEASVVPVSSLTGQGLGSLKDELSRLALLQPHRLNEHVLRLPLDRMFTVPGFGTVVTGTLHEGGLRKGETLVLQPRGKAVRVRGMQVHGRTRDEVYAATRLAVNLAGVDVDEVHRGDVLAPDELVKPTTIVDVELVAAPDAPPFRHRRQVGVHAFTWESTCRLLLYDLGEQEGITRLARLRLAKPTVFFPGDRFVLRQLSPPRILGGGRVLDAHPDLKRRKAHTKLWLESIKTMSPSEQLLERVGRRALLGVGVISLIRELGLTRDTVEQEAKRLVADRELVRGPGGDEGDRYLVPQSVLESSQRILQELSKRPDGIASRSELISKTQLQDWVFDLGLHDLEIKRKARLSGSQVVLEREAPRDDRQANELRRVEDLYRLAGLGAPIVEEAARMLKMEPKSLHAMNTILLRDGTLVRMGEDRLLIHKDALAKLREDVMVFRGQTMDVARFKQMTGLTRKHVVPLLEHLDRIRVTANRGGTRIVL